MISWQNEKTNLRRGDRLFFNVSGGGIQGVGRLQQIDRGNGRKLFNRYGGQVAWTQREVEGHLRDKQGMIYVFDWFRPFRQFVTRLQIQEIVPKFNPQTVYRIPHSAGDQLESLEGVK